MEGEISLGGGGNADEDYTSLEYFSKGIKKLLYIPLAFPTENYSKCLEWCKGHFARFGITDITMHDDLSLEIDLNKFDGIYIGGGSTYKLLKFIKENNFDKNLIEFYKKGGKIGGGSAGAILFGYDIDIGSICEDRDKNTVGLKDKKGLNLCDGWDVQVHYKNTHEEINQNYVKKSKRNIIAIPDDSSVIVNQNGYKVIGDSEVSLITENDVKKIGPDESFKLK